MSPHVIQKGSDDDAVGVVPRLAIWITVKSGLTIFRLNEQTNNKEERGPLK